MVPVVKNLSARQETQEMWVPSLGSEDPLEEEMAPHCSILAWEIPRTEEPGGLVHGVAKSRARQSIEAGPHTGSKMKSARALACRGPGPGRRPPSRLLSSPRTWRCSRRCCKKQAPPAPLLCAALFHPTPAVFEMPIKPSLPKATSHQTTSTWQLRPPRTTQRPLSTHGAVLPQITPLNLHSPGRGHSAPVLSLVCGWSN